MSSDNSSGEREATDLERWQAIGAALFENVVPACDHIGEPDAGTPVLCYQHMGVGLMCMPCLIDHANLDHIAEDLPKLRCAACQNKLNKLDGSDISNMVAWSRRSVMLALAFTNEVTAVTQAPPGKAEHVSYAGTTIIAFEHLVCFACRAAIDAQIAGGAN